MSLILVVEPDSRHAAQLATMARNHLHAELVMAESGDHAVAALADRVPDIVLTAPLLPRHDEAVLASYLRALGTAGAHVQTLTIPILSTPGSPQRVTRGRFRRGSDPVVPDGCDPALFAEQVGQYLRRARQVRTDGVVVAQPTQQQEPLPEPAAPNMLHVEPEVAPSVMASSSPASSEVISGQPVDDIDLTAFLNESPDPGATVEAVEPEPIVERRYVTPTYVPPAYVPPPPPVAATPIYTPPPVAATPVYTPPPVAEAPVYIPPVAAAPVYTPPPATPVYTPPPIGFAPEPPRRHVVPEEPPRRQIVVPEVLPPQPPEVVPAELVIPQLPPPALHSRPAKHRPISPEAHRYREPEESSNLPAVIMPEAPHQQEPQPSANLPQVITIPAPGGNGQSVSVAVAVSVQVAASASPAPPSTPRQRPSGAKPIQDEWGFFDPDQCGFKALLARLDAIATPDESES